VSGDSGTSGYLDGQDMTYQIFSKGDTWIVTTEYHHSTHSIVLALSSDRSSATSPNSGAPIFSPLEISPLVTLPIIVVLLGIVIFLLIKRKNRTATPA